MGQPPPKGGGGWGAKPPNIFECWWLFGPWQAAVSSKQQQASRPKGLIFTRELPNKVNCTALLDATDTSIPKLYASLPELT